MAASNNNHQNHPHNNHSQKQHHQHHHQHNNNIHTTGKSNATTTTTTTGATTATSSPSSSSPAASPSLVSFNSSSSSSHSLHHPQLRLPPLAHLDEFSSAEDDGFLSNKMAASNGDIHEEGITRRRTSSFARSSQSSSKSSRSSRTRPNADVTVVEVNGAATSWLASTIDLEKIFLENGDYEFGPYGKDVDQPQENNSTTTPHTEAKHCPLIQFADRYFNVHNVTTGYSGAITKTVNKVRHKGSAANHEVIALEDLVRYTKHGTIPTSHVHLLSPENTHISCSIFKDLCKYMKEDVSGGAGGLGAAGGKSGEILHSILTYGLERTELRDEIFCQLMRQTTENPHEDAALRIWGVMALCCGVFSPSHTLRLYLLSHLRHHAESGESLKRQHFAEYCLRQTEKQPNRTQTPSLLETEAVVRLQPLVYRIYLLDGQTRGISLEATASLKDAMDHIQTKLQLQNMHGWALYESTPDCERHIQENEYMADVLARWEQEVGAERTVSAASVIVPPRMSSRLLRHRKHRKPRTHRKGGGKHRVSGGGGGAVQGSLLLRGGSSGRQQQRDTSALSLLASVTPKKSGSPAAKLALHGSYGKLIFCKRIYGRLQNMPDDPVEYHLLYAQAQNYLVRADDYFCPPAAAVHLAGLQAQIEYGSFDEEKMYRYDDVDEFLPARVLNSSHRDWSMEVAAAHKRFGKDRSAAEAKLKYLWMVCQLPLYACSKVFAHYRGLWPYGVETLLALNYDGLKLLSLPDKLLILDVYYPEIESIILEESHEEFFIILQLKNVAGRPGRQKCYMFECQDYADFTSLVEAYYPSLASWVQEPPHSPRKKFRQKFKPCRDWIKLYEDILSCRRRLVTQGIIQPPPNEGGGLLQTALLKSRSWLCRLSGRGGCNNKMAANVEENGGDDEDEVDVHSAYWNFTRAPFKTSMLAFGSHEMEDVSARMFNSTLVYTGLESAAVLEDMDLIVVVQTLIIKCMENADLCNEFYIQLIRQTTATQTEGGGSSGVAGVLAGGSRNASLRYWHLMTMATCVMHPPNPVIFRYLNLHLKFCAMDQSTDEGKYALFCIKSLYRTCEKRVRKYPPSFKEIAFVSKGQPIDARVHLPDGHQMLIEFDSAATAEEVMQLIKAKAGMRLDAEGFGIYQVIGNTDECILPEETLADSLYKWERWAKGSSNHDNPNPKDIKFIFRKRIFIEPYVNMNDPVEIEMLYTQSVTDVFEEKIPLTKRDAVQLCALRAQTEFGDYVDSFDYIDKQSFSSVTRILPRHLRDLMQTSEMSAVYKKLTGMTGLEANIAFLGILREWPLYGATMFDVSQSDLSPSLPTKLWLAVSQLGVHLMEQRGHIIYATYPFSDLATVECNSKSFTLTTASEVSLYFITSQGASIVRLINDYKALLASPTLTPTLTPPPGKPLKDKGMGKKSRDSLPSTTESPPPTNSSSTTLQQAGQQKEEDKGSEE